MMNDRHPSPDYSREEKQPGGDSSHPKGVIRPGSAQSGHGPPPSSMGPPPSYTTVTMTTDNTPGARVTEINLNIGYYKSLPGIVKIVQMVSYNFTSFFNSILSIVFNIYFFLQVCNSLIYFVFRYLESFLWLVPHQPLGIMTGTETLLN